MERLKKSLPDSPSKLVLSEESAASGYLHPLVETGRNNPKLDLPHHHLISTGSLRNPETQMGIALALDIYPCLLPLQWADPIGSSKLVLCLLRFQGTNFTIAVAGILKTCHSHPDHTIAIRQGDDRAGVGVEVGPEAGVEIAVLALAGTPKQRLMALHLDARVVAMAIKEALDTMAISLVGSVTWLA